MIDQRSQVPGLFSNWIAGFLATYYQNDKPSHQQSGKNTAKACKSTKLISFLHQTKMEPTPENYQMAWEYHFGASARFRQAIDDAIAEHGYLTDMIIKQITADHLNHWNAVELAKLVAGGNQVLNNGSQVIRQSRDDSRAYGEALETELKSIKPLPGESAGHYSALVSITKTMAVKSFEAQRQLEEASETLEGMRTKLADATQKAETDQLTGLPNRWAFEKHLSNALLRAREAMEPLSVAFVDVDHFKAINDDHGHDAGDRVLKRIAKALNELSNNHCHVARHGGEEFVLLFVDMSAEEAKKVVDRTRAALSEHDFTNGKVSFSAGISTLSADGDSRAMLRRADSALYAAKANGRDQVVLGE